MLGGAENWQALGCREGGTRAYQFVCRAWTFQSTRPRRARRGCDEAPQRTVAVSIHAPAKGATPERGCLARGAPVSIHAPVKGATWADAAVIKTIAFQSTRPRRARHGVAVGVVGDLRFNPRAREGRDRGGRSRDGLGRCFNPRACEGRDRPHRPRVRQRRVSIHAPVKGATREVGAARFLGDVSIHAPVKGATCWPARMSAVVGFQSTRP